MLTVTTNDQRAGKQFALGSPRPPLRRHGAGLVTLLVWVTALGLAPATSAADPNPAPLPTPTAVLIGASPNPATLGTTVTLSATVTPAPGGGTITWNDLLNPAAPLAVSVVDPTTGIASLTVGLVAGPHQLMATFSGTPGYAASQSAPLFLPVVSAGNPTTTVIAASAASVEEHAPITLTATVSPPFASNLLFVDGPVVLGTVAVEPGTGTASLATNLRGVGLHVITALELGDGTNAGSVSAPLTLSVTPDLTVLASGQTVSPSSFFPFKDGYRDTTVVKGVRGEPESVALSIYNPAGKKIRTAALGTGFGAYSWTWNGRSSSGILQPAGRYRVVQVLTDIARHKKTVASFVTVSAKRVVWKTASVTKWGDAYNDYGESPFAWVSSPFSRFSRGVHLYGNVLDSWAYVEYDFSLPSAVEYGKITFSATGELYNLATTTGPAWLSLWDYAADNDETVYGSTGLSYGTYSISSGSTALINGRRVRAFISVYGDDTGNWDVEKVKLTYRYAVLQ